MAPMRVLIVDDEATVRANLAAYLEDEGIEVLTASSGEEALSLLNREDDVAVCIMDMRLPGMDGNDSIRVIHLRHPHIRFIVHTATAQYSLPDDLRAIGLTDTQVFRKPVTDMAPVANEIQALGRHRETRP